MAVDDEKNPLEEYIRKVVIDTLKTYPVDSTLKHQDATIIINAIMPEIDQLIARRIKTHLKEILAHISNQFKLDKE
jgi:hypothetical protein